jgi:hypothetical protein
VIERVLRDGTYASDSQDQRAPYSPRIFAILSAPRSEGIDAVRADVLRLLRLKLGEAGVDGLGLAGRPLADQRVDNGAATIDSRRR